MGTTARKRVALYFKAVWHIKNGEKKEALDHLIQSGELGCLIALRTLEAVYNNCFEEWGVRRSEELCTHYREMAKEIQRSLYE